MRGGFWIKVAGAIALVLLADWLFLFHEPGWTLGLFALAWTSAVALCLPAVRRHPAARGCLVLAAGLGLMLVEAPGPLAVLLFLVAITSAVLLPGARFRDAAGWVVGGLVQGVTGLVRPIRDGARLLRLHGRRGGGSVGDLVRLVAPALIGGTLFVALFASANPIVGSMFEGLRLPFPDEAAPHLLFAGLVTVLVWPTLRPGAWRPQVAVAERASPIALPTRTVTLALTVFNAVFAIENALDLAFLWSGAPLPAGVTLADYAHRGAYTLIVTALLAAAFVLVALHPKAEAAGSRAVRRLLVVWIAQNLALVASSARRLANYVAAYSLTELRIAAFAWMALVAVGLALIGWRLFRGRSARWLINANAAAAGVVLLVGSVVDLGAVAARYNVRHAGEGEPLDLCYLASLGPAALLPMIEVEHRARGVALRGRVAGLRAEMIDRLAREQDDWRSWSWRNARRLAIAREALGPTPLPIPDQYPGCPRAYD